MVSVIGGFTHLSMMIYTNCATNKTNKIRFNLRHVLGTMPFNFIHVGLEKSGRKLGRLFGFHQLDVSGTHNSASATITPLAPLGRLIVNG